MAEEKKKRKKKKKKEIIHKKTCKYCTHFFDSKERLGDTRFCRPKDDYVSTEEETCNSFMPRDRFWCERCSYWMSTRACSIRSAKQLMNCEKCDQQKVVQLILDEQEDIEPTVIKRKIKKIKRLDEQDNIEPVVIRRKTKKIKRLKRKR